MKKFKTVLLMISCLLLISSLLMRATANPNGFPTSEQQTLMASLSPPNPSIGDDIRWLIWTDPNCSGHEVGLEIIDLHNYTVIYNEKENLGTYNQCGSLEKWISTDGYKKHLYEFRASMIIGDMTINCSRYLDFMGLGLMIYAYVSPYRAIPGEDINLTIYEGNYPYVEAYANITVYNSTHPELWTRKNVLIPEENGTCTITISTDGWSSSIQWYWIDITVTSDLGTIASRTWFTLEDLIVDIEYHNYYIGELVNISIRTHPTITQAGLQIFAWGSPPVVDEYVSLTNGKATRSYNSSGWTPDNYNVKANITINLTPVYDQPYFTLYAFFVWVDCDKSEYVAGENANITVSTYPEQPGAEFNVTVSNSTWHTLWTYADRLDPNGEASVLMSTTGLPPDEYDVEVWVNNTQYVEYGWTDFDVIQKTFNIEAHIEPFTVAGYAMPCLTVTTEPGQTNANLTIIIAGMYGGYYLFTPTYWFEKTNFECSSYEYLLPLPGMLNSTPLSYPDAPNGTHLVGVLVASDIGENDTFTAITYSNGFDTDGDGLSDTEELAEGTFPNVPDSDEDGFFDGIEVFHGSDPMVPESIIPEQPLVPWLILATVSTFTVLAAKLRKRKPYK